MMRRFLWMLSAVTWAWPTVGLAEELPPLIPRAVLFGNPDKARPRISPDGSKLAYLAPDHGVMNVWVRRVGQRDDRAVTHDRKHGIRSYQWAPNGKQLLYIQDKNGDENWHLYAVDLETSVSVDLTPFPGVQARVVAVEPNHADRILVAMNDRDPKHHDVYQVDLMSGERTLVAENTQELVAWTADAALRVRGALKLTPGGGTELVVRDEATGDWRTLESWGPVDVLNSGPIAFTPDGRGLYIISSAGSDTGELRRIDLATGKEETLAADRQVDVADLLWHPLRRTIQAVAFNKERIHWKVLDASIRKDFAAIRRLRRGDFRVLNRDHADRTWLVAFTADDGPRYYYAYHRDTGAAELLFSNREALECLTLAKMVPISYLARDGLTIHGYLTIPPGQPAVKRPMVVLVHSGPWTRRDTWGYDGVTQWLANRGYAVLQLNYRGSAGYGKAFLNAANREWGGKMQDDLIDGVRWTVSKGIADPKRIAIFGESYGGYAALVGLTKTPAVFCCAVDLYGLSNLITFMESIPPYIKPFEPLLWNRIGHPVRDAAFLKERSPLFHVDRITKPLLIGQGANDPRVKKSESLQIVEAMRRAGKAVEYVEYADEGHGFARPENRLDFFAKAERFLAKHLGGRYEE